MAVYFVTGKLGGGKSLVSVARIREYLLGRRIVATNLDLNLEELLPITRKDTQCYRLPDKPTFEDFDNLPSGNDTYDESQNGLIVLDELGTWYNSRSWNEKGRKEVNDGFLHVRKKGWDVIFIVQDVSIVDKQLRDSLCEHLVICRRLDRINIPLVGGIYKLITGNRLPLPRIHTAKVHYGDNEQALVVDRWTYRGNDLFKAYDTKQIFSDSGNGVACMLTPWHLKGRYHKQRSYIYYVNKFINYVLYPARVFCAVVGRNYDRAQPGHRGDHRQHKYQLIGFTRGGPDETVKPEWR